VSFEGILAQVIDFHRGHSGAVIISCLPEDTIQQMKRLKERNYTDSEELLT